MGYSRDKKSKRTKKSLQKEMAFPDQVNIHREKQKAREMKNSPWWRKKISSGTCYYCGKKCKPEDLTMDHKIPLARGGRSEKINLVPACKDCNNKKKYLLAVEWDEYMNSLKEK